MSKETKEMHPEGRELVDRRAFLKMVAGAAAGAGVVAAMPEIAAAQRSLLELVKMRASQISGCAFCIDMHSKDARVNGETEQRLYALSAWRETLQRRWERYQHELVKGDFRCHFEKT